MNIESIILRDGGTHVPMGTTSYHFAPQPDGAHVAAVEDDAHIARFLSIPEGFRMYRPGQPAAAPVEIAPAAASVATAPAKSLGFPDSFDIGGATYSLQAVTDLAVEASELGLSNWNELPDEARATRIEAQLDKLQDAADEAAREALMSAPVPKTRDELVALHVAKFGSKPHHKWDAAKIQAVLDKAE